MKFSCANVSLGVLGEFPESKDGLLADDLRLVEIVNDGLEWPDEFLGAQVAHGLEDADRVAL